MNSNLNNMSASNTLNKPGNPYNANENTSNNTTNNWQQNTNTWHSANPLVMNHQLPPPTATTTTTPNNNSNFSSLDDLDPFGGSNNKPKATNSNTQANTFTLQKPTVDYIYPVGYQQQMKTNANTSLMGNSMNLNSLMNSNSSMTPLMPQTTGTTNAQHSSQDANNFNTLSQQDILSFLN